MCEIVFKVNTPRCRIGKSKVCAFGILLDIGEFPFIKVILIHTAHSLIKILLLLYFLSLPIR